ncbi:hypothetical protein HDV05_002325, partial [Chytridiales sp. JEL 0842]
VSWADVRRPTAIAPFKAEKRLNPSVAALRLFPGITEATVRAFLSPPIQGVVLETFGSGNAPSNRPELLAAIKEATDRGVVIVNCTQCLRGLVSDLYETGKALVKIGVVPGSDMTPECALTKLCYLLGKGLPPNVCREMVRRDLRGELTVVTQNPRFTYKLKAHSLIHSLITSLESDALTTPLGTSLNMLDINSSGRGFDTADKVLAPLLLCNASRTGDINALKLLTEEFGEYISLGDYDKRTPLHVAASENQLLAVHL